MCSPVDRDRAGRVAVIRREWPLWLRETLLGVALGLIIILGAWILLDRRDRIAENHQQICAIERYFEERFEIDKAITSTPAAVFAARLAAIRRLEHAIGTSCNHSKGASP